MRFALQMPAETEIRTVLVIRQPVAPPGQHTVISYSTRRATTTTTTTVDCLHHFCRPESQTNDTSVSFNSSCPHQGSSTHCWESHYYSCPLCKVLQVGPSGIPCTAVQEVCVSIVPLGVDIVQGFVYSSLTSSLVTFKTDNSMSAHARQRVELNWICIAFSKYGYHAFQLSLFQLFSLLCLPSWLPHLDFVSN
jgi:hypothetical protein